MKVSIRRSGVVVSALALALAVPALSAGNAWAAAQDAVVTGADGGAPAVDPTLGDTTYTQQDKVTKDGANVSVKDDTIADGKKLTIKGGAGTATGAGGNASWSGSFIGGNADTQGASDISLTSGSGLVGGATAGAVGGSVTVNFTNGVTLAASKKLELLAGDAVNGAAANGGDSGSVTLVINGGLSQAADATGATEAALVINATGKAAGQAASTGNGGNVGNVSLTVLDDSKIGSFTVNGVSGGVVAAAASGNGGNGGVITTKFEKAAAFDSALAIKGGNGADSSGSGTGGAGSAISQSYGSLTVGLDTKKGDLTVTTGKGGDAKSTGQGGAGSVVALEVAKDAVVIGDLKVTGAAGGKGSDVANGGTGGAGGSTSITVGGNLTVRADKAGTPAGGDLTVGGNNGGDSGTIGNGGAGGAFALTVAGATTITGNASFTGGTGGDAVKGSNATATGGAAGDVTNTYGTSFKDKITTVVMNAGTAYGVTAGNGGAAGTAVATDALASGKAGRGANVTETYVGAANYAGTLDITGGTGGDANLRTTETAEAGVGGNIAVAYGSDAKATGKITIAGGAGGKVVGAGKAGDSGTVQVSVARDLLGDAALKLGAANGGSATDGTATGKAGNGQATTVTVARDLIVSGAHTASAGSAGNSGDLAVAGNSRPGNTASAGNGGDLTVSVKRVYGSTDAVTYSGGQGGNAGAKVAGANAGKANVTVGVFDVAKGGSFAGGNAGSATAGFAGGNAGDVNATVTGRAAFFGEGLSVAAGKQYNAEDATKAKNGAAGNATFTANEGYIYSVGAFGITGGDGAEKANTDAGAARVSAKSLTLGSVTDGKIQGTASAYNTDGKVATHAGSATLNVGILRTNDGAGSKLTIDRQNGTVSVTADNVVAVDEDLSLVLNERPIGANKINPGSYQVSFTNLGMSGASNLAIASANETVAYTWVAGGHLYAANAHNGTDNAANTLTVTRKDDKSANIVAVQQSAAGRTAAFDVANLDRVEAKGAVPQILAVNATSADAFGLAINDTTKVNILGADNLRLGQTVYLVNTAAGSTFTGHNGAGTIGDTYGNVADATYSLGIVTAADKKDYLQATITSFEIRKDWVIDNSRDLETADVADGSDVRRLSLPGTLKIVDNRYAGPNNLGILVDDNKGTRGRADLWADKIHVATTNTVSRDWIENGNQITSTTLHFGNAVAGNLKDRSVRGVAFNTLALGSGSATNLRGDMAGADGVGNYAFGGRLEVGDKFRDYHTSARLTNDASVAAAALTVNQAQFHLSNDLPGRIAEADAWQAKFDGQRLANGTDGVKNKLVTETGANGIVALEVVGGTAPIVHFDRDWTVDLTQRLDSTDEMETLRKKQAYAPSGINPRLTLVDRIQGDVSTIRGKTFAEDRTATIEARSWAQKGFIEGVYAVGYGNNDATDKIRDWGTNDSVIAEFRGIAADLGKSALQARTASETLLNQGQDLLVDAFDTALPLGAYNPAKGIQPVAMVAVGGGHREVDTGSNVSGTGFSLAAGPGLSVDHEYGRTTVGVLFEAGWGDYDLNNAFAWRGAFNAKADSSYYGGAVVVRHDSFCNGIYADASVRAGYVDSEYKGHQSATNFDTDATYVGGHVGLGMLVDTWQDGQADLYAKGLFTHMGSDTVHNTAGEELSFDGSTSIRSRLGARLSHNFMPTLKGYVGAAWEYEFDGKQQGSARKIGSQNVAHIPAIDVKGHTGIGEVGVQWTAMENLSVGAGFQGSVGQRDSYGGTARVMYKW